MGGGGVSKLGWPVFFVIEVRWWGKTEKKTVFFLLFSLSSLSLCKIALNSLPGEEEELARLASSVFFVFSNRRKKGKKRRSLFFRFFGLARFFFSKRKEKTSFLFPFSFSPREMAVSSSPSLSLLSPPSLSLSIPPPRRRRPPGTPQRQCSRRSRPTLRRSISLWPPPRAPPRPLRGLRLCRQ